MKIVLSKLPKSGWWNKGVPKYPDNPAMKEGRNTKWHFIS